jgi:phage-related protein
VNKNIHFVSSSKTDLINFPEDVRREVGFALFLAQTGDKAVNALPLVNFGGASMLEIRSDDGGNTFRSVYTTKFDKAVYVLHAFVKKSKSGIATPTKEMRLIRSRLKLAEAHYKENYLNVESKNVGRQER